MKFPRWALENEQMRVRYLLGFAALEVAPTGGLRKLADAANINYSTLMWSVVNGVSPRVAESICEVAKDSGIRPHWLTNPAWIRVDNVTGEILE